MRPCPRCNAPVPVGSTFCPGCGVPQQMFELVAAPTSVEGAAAAGVLKALVRADMCVGCGTCVASCPEPGAIVAARAPRRGRQREVQGAWRMRPGLPGRRHFGERGRRREPRHRAARRFQLRNQRPGHLHRRGTWWPRVDQERNQRRQAGDRARRTRPPARRGTEGRRDRGSRRRDCRLRARRTECWSRGASPRPQVRRSSSRVRCRTACGSIRGTSCSSPSRCTYRSTAISGSPTLQRKRSFRYGRRSSRTRASWCAPARRCETIVRDGAVFRVETPIAQYRARRVVLATGRRGTPRRLGVPGEELGKVFYDIVEMEEFARQARAGRRWRRQCHRVRRRPGTASRHRSDPVVPRGVVLAHQGSQSREARPRRGGWQSPSFASAATYGRSGRMSSSSTPRATR